MTTTKKEWRTPALLAIAWLVGCSAGSDVDHDLGGLDSGVVDADAPFDFAFVGPDIASCGRGSAPGSSLRILAMSPTEVPLHGTDVTISFDGDPPPSWIESGIVSVNGSSGWYATLLGRFNGKLIFSPSSMTPGPIRLALLDNWNGSELAWMDCAGDFVAVPATPSVSVDHPLTPLHPELARPCARHAVATLVNTGDLAFTVQAPVLSGPSAFTLQTPMTNCAGASLSYNQHCDVPVCFSASTPMQYAALLDLVTGAGGIGASFDATVLPPTTGLDPTFGGTGAIALSPVYSNGSALPVESLASDGATIVAGIGDGLFFVSPNGSVTSPSTGFATVESVAAGNGGAFVVSDAAQGCFPSLVHYANDGTADSSFAATLPQGQLCHAALAVQSSSSVILVVGDSVTSLESSVEAHLSDGRLDTAFGTGGQLSVPGGQLISSPERIAIDAQDRLYVATIAGIARVRADGSVDPSFAFASSSVRAIALDASQHLLVSVGAGVVRLDDSGVATTVPLTSPPSDPVIDIAQDAGGRLYLTTSKGSVTRFLSDGSFDADVGFEGAAQVVCRPGGGCAVVGQTATEGYILELL